LSLVDRCYRNEAFTTDQVHLLLKWRRRLSNLLQSLGQIDCKPNQPTFVQQRRSIKSSVRPMKSSSSIYHSNYPSNSTGLSKYNSEPQNNSLIEPNLIRRPTRSPTLIYPTNEESNDLNIQTSFSSVTSNPQRHDGAYLANNQHQALTRKASIDPYGEANRNNRNKLCKTFSDPNKIRFQNPNTQMNHIRSQQNLIRMISTPYSQQQRQFTSRSPPTSTMETLSVSPIKKCYSENERSDYYGKKHDDLYLSQPLIITFFCLFIGNNNNSALLSNTNDMENSDDQRHNNSDLELFCRQITENAISDDGKDLNLF
jgi:hypothetical protein